MVRKGGRLSIIAPPHHPPPPPHQCVGLEEGDHFLPCCRAHMALTRKVKRRLAVLKAFDQKAEP